MDALTLVLALKALQGGGGGGTDTTNFNNLTNRPKYNGVTMTDQTNIPAVPDIKINGTSIVSSGVANIPAASSDTLGVVKTNGSYGIVSGGGLLIIGKATDEDIVAKADSFKPIVPGNLNKAVMEGLGNNGFTWSDAYKQSARNTIGIMPEASYTVEMSDGTTKTLKIYSELV